MRFVTLDLSTLRDTGDSAEILQPGEACEVLRCDTFANISFGDENPYLPAQPGVRFCNKGSGVIRVRVVNLTGIPPAPITPATCGYLVLAVYDAEQYGADALSRGLFSVFGSRIVAQADAQNGADASVVMTMPLRNGLWFFTRLVASYSEVNTSTVDAERLRIEEDDGAGGLIPLYEIHSPRAGRHHHEAEFSYPLVALPGRDVTITMPGGEPAATSDCLVRAYGGALMS